MVYIIVEGTDLGYLHLVKAEDMEKAKEAVGGKEECFKTFSLTDSQINALMTSPFCHIRES